MANRHLGTAAGVAMAPLFGAKFWSLNFDRKRVIFEFWGQNSSQIQCALLFLVAAKPVWVEGFLALRRGEGN